MGSYRRARILSVGTAVPPSVMTNDDFAAYLDTSDEWIYKRTGIRKRHIYPRGCPGTAAELGSRASRIALEKAGVAAGDVDGLICATFTPDAFYPSTACSIQAALHADRAFAFDLSAACSGFIYALSVADGMIRSGQARTILVVGSEIISRAVDWDDRATAILFGDAAGAVVIQESDDEDRGILSTWLKSDGTQTEILRFPAWGENRHITMNGSEVYKIAVRMMSGATLKAAERAGLALDDIDLLIPHQANIRIINAIGAQLGISAEKVVANVETFGNTSAASIPLALETAWDEGRISAGTRVIFTALGGGVTIGSAAVRF